MTLKSFFTLISIFCTIIAKTWCAQTTPLLEHVWSEKKKKKNTNKSHVIDKNISNWICITKCILHGFMKEKLI